MTLRIRLLSVLALLAGVVAVVAIIQLDRPGAGDQAVPPAQLEVALGEDEQIVAAVDLNQTDSGQPARGQQPLEEEAATTGTIDELFDEVDQQAPGFGGMFYDEQGRLNVYLQDPAQADAAEAAIASLFGADQIPEEGINVLAGEYSASQLNEWHARMAELLAVPGVILTDVDEAANRLQVGVEDIALTSVVEQRLIALEVPRAAVEIEETEPVAVAASPGNTLRDEIRPLVAGLQIHFEDPASFGSECTLGFIATLGNQTGFVTNSHCTGIEGAVTGAVFYQPNLDEANKVGVEAKDPPHFFCTANAKSEPTPDPSGQPCRWSDSAFVRLDDGVAADLGFIANTAPIGSFNIQNTYRIVEVKNAPIMGEVLNKVGRTSGWSQGPVFATCQNIKSTDNIVRLCQDQVNAFLAPGDSGSPVFGLAGSPNDVRLYGILWGETANGFVFSNMSQVQRDLGPLNVLAPGVTPVKPAPPAATKAPDALQNFAFTNNSTNTASDLEVRFSAPVTGAELGLAAKLDGTPVTPNPAACPTPAPGSITIIGGDTVRVVWPSKCAQKGAQVILGVTSSTKPLKVLSVTWSAQGAPLPSQTPTTTPAPDPKALQSFAFFNNTTGLASGLRVQFSAILETVSILPGPTGCTLDPASTFLGDTVIIAWTSKCAQKTEQATLLVGSQTNPLKVISVTWTNGGAPLPTQTPQTPTATPTSTPTKALPDQPKAPADVEIRIPVRWCGVNESPSIATPSIITDPSPAITTNDIMWREHERPSDSIYLRSGAILTFRSAATAAVEDFPIIPDIVGAGGGGDVVDPALDGGAEFERLIERCRERWQDQDQTITGITSVHINQFVDNDGIPTDALCAGGVGNASQTQIDLGRAMVIDPAYYLTASTFAGSPRIIDNFGSIVGHCFGRALSLTTVDGDPNNVMNRTFAGGSETTVLIASELTGAQIQILRDQAVRHIPDIETLPPIPTSERLIGDIRVEPPGEALTNEEYLNIKALAIALDQTGGRTSVAMSVFGLFPDDITGLEYFFLWDTDNNPNNGGLAKDIKNTSGLNSGFTGADFMARVQVDVVKGVAQASSTLWKFDQTLLTPQFVEVSDSSAKAKVFKDSIGMLREEGAAPGSEAVAIGQTVFLDFPTALLEETLNSESLSRAAAFVQDPATGTTDDMETAIAFDVATFPQGSFEPEGGAAPGDFVTVVVTGLIPNHETHVLFGTEEVATGQTDGTGAIILHFRIPAGARLGQHLVTVGTLAVTADRIFTVVPPPSVVKEPGLSNLFLTRQSLDKVPPETCLAGNDRAVMRQALTEKVGGKDKHLDPRDLGGFSFKVNYDETKVCVELWPGPLAEAWVAAGGACVIEDTKTNPTLQGSATIFCVSLGKQSYEVDDNLLLAEVIVRPMPDEYSVMRPNNGNGNVVQIINKACKLTDQQGDPISTASGLPTCTDADVTIRYLEGDVVPDCVVDTVDTQAEAFRWGSQKGTLLFNDFNNLEPSKPKQDDDIDINDLQFVYGRFGSTCDGPYQQPEQPPVNPKALP